jgi:drug/metabolite transporter (DMT)-like permease
MRNLDPVVSFAAICHYTAFGIVTMMLVFGRQWGSEVLSFPAGRFGMLAASALIGIAISHVLYYAALARIGVALSTGVILLQPFITSASSYFLFGERLTGWQWLSGLAAIGGAALMLGTQRRLSRGETPAMGSTDENGENPPVFNSPTEPHPTRPRNGG